MRHERALATVVGLAAGLVAVIASGRVWYQVTGHGFTGSELTDRASQTLPLAAMAGLALTLLVGRWGRRIAGVLVLALGAGTAVVAVQRHVPSADQLENAVGSSLASGHATHAHLLSLAAGVVVALCGLVFVLRAGRWRGPTRRFERATGERPRSVANSLDAWRAMDSGADPTADPTLDPTIDPVDPVADPTRDEPASGRSGSGVR